MRRVTTALALWINGPDASSMRHRDPYGQARAIRREGTPSTQSRDNVTHLAEMDCKRESDQRIEELVIELAEREKKRKEVVTELEETRRQNRGLNETLAASEKDVATLKHEMEKLDRIHRKRYKELHNESQEIIDQRNKSIADLSHTTDNLTSKKAALEIYMKKQALQISQLQHETETQRSHITELTGAILHSSTITTASRDDDYFSGEFARLTGAIRQWVLRYFEPSGAPELNIQDLPETVAESLAKTVLAYPDTPTPDSKIIIGRKEIEAVIAHWLTTEIFGCSLVMALFRWPTISTAPFPAVSDRETHKWRAQTASMLTQHSDFEAHFAEAVEYITEVLQDFFPDHTKPGPKAQRIKVLRTIVEQAARLEVEISREVSVFQMPYISPGSRYETDQVDDRSGIVDGNDDSDDEDDDEEEEEHEEEEGEEGEEEEQDMQSGEKKGVQKRREFVVDTVLFPPVVRLEFDDEGKIATTPITIRKGVVTAIRSL